MFDDIAHAKVGPIPLMLRAPRRTKERGLVLALDPGPPEGLEAFARALPFPQVDSWKAYLGLPLVGYRQPTGGVEEISRRQRSDYLLELLDPALSGALRDMPVVASHLRKQLDLKSFVPLGLVGVSAGGLAALLALADRPVPIAAAVIVGAGPDADAAVAAAERAFGITYKWTSAARACAAPLDFAARAAEIARGSPALLVIRGSEDDVVPVLGIERLHAALRPHYQHAPERLCFETLPGIGHGLDDAGKVAAIAEDWLAAQLNDS